MKKLFFLSVLFLIMGGVSFGQITEEELSIEKAKLQKKNNALKNEIAGLNKDLQRNKTESNSSILYIKGLEKKISTQNSLIFGLKKENRYLDDEIYLTQLQINKLGRELGELKKEYKDVLVKAYKNKSVENKLLFVLSSKNLKQAFHRIKYLQRYSDYQMGQADEIIKKKEDIIQKKEEKENSKREKDEVIAQQTLISEELENEKINKQKGIEEYKRKAGNISQLIAEKRQQQNEINAEIDNIIKEEIRLAKERAEKDKKSWDSAAGINTIAAFQDYLNEWPNGDFAQSARKNIQQLEADNSGWQTARGSHTKIAYQQYLENFPQGQFASTARLEISKFEEAEEVERLERERLAREKAQREAEEKAMSAAAAEAAEAKAAEAAKKEEIVIAEAKKPERVENPVPDKPAAPKFTERAGTIELSKTFSNNRGSLPWPVSRGQIVGHFGLGKHPILGIDVENDGVDIATNRGVNAKSVFDGTVASVMTIPGGNKTILIKHGDYFTVYGNLSYVSVKKGDKVSRGQDIGRIYTDSNGDTILNFQIRSGTVKQNPERWLAGN